MGEELTRAQIFQIAHDSRVGNAKLHDVAIEAAHEYARATNCPAGYSVTRWLHEQTQAATRAGFAALSEQETSNG